jgi:hypothetical protein
MEADVRARNRPLPDSEKSATVSDAMYVIDEHDQVVPLDDLPQSSVGAPCPVVLAEEGRLVVAFFVQETPADWDGTTARMVGSDSPGEPAAIVRFTGPRASMFGSPNDEAFEGHPLASRGLQPYGAFEVRRSSWIRALERMNSVHPSHRPEYFSTLRHFVLAFHDSTFECVAHGYSWERAKGPLTEVIVREAAPGADHESSGQANVAHTFADSARRYCTFIEEAQTLALSARLRKARELLAELVHIGSHLPEGDANSPDAEADVAMPKEWPGAGLFDSYTEIFDPYVEDAPVAGSLTDDLLDTYRDVRRGLVLYDAGHVGSAVWEWRFHFDYHWGDHAVDALRALQRACQRAIAP